MAEKSDKSNQGQFDGMPVPKGAAKKCLEWLAKQGRISALQSEQGKIGADILEWMEKEKRQVLKIKDPDTGAFRDFKIDEGTTKLRVHKVPEKVGQPS